jgi:GST-like protein
MIDLYYAATPNGLKVRLFLEEAGLPYRLLPVSLSGGEQFTPDFLAISPNNKIPAIVDHDGPGGKPLAVFESGAILTYLADKTGKLLAPSGPARYVAFEWMYFNVGGTGPMTGQLGHFAKFAKDKIPYAIDRYTQEVVRLHGVLDKRLGEARYLAGDDYTMADVINVTWVIAATKLGIDISGANLKRWVDEISARPAVQRALALKP